jgi:hypothetical protein
MKTNQQKLFEHFFPHLKEQEDFIHWLAFPDFILKCHPDEPITTSSMALWEEEMLEQYRTKYLNAST